MLPIPLGEGVSVVVGGGGRVGGAYRDLKEPEGWVFSSLRKMLHPAAREMVGEKRRGVSTQGLGGSGEREPMFCGGVGCVCCWWC